MDEFTLHPWEMPSASLSVSSGKADATIEINWQGKRRILLLRIIRLRDVYGCTFAHDQDSLTTGNWLLVERNHGTLHVWNVHHNPRFEEVAQRIENDDIELARFCVVPDGQQTRRAMTVASGESLWLSVGMGRQEPFDLPMQPTSFFSDGMAHFRQVSAELACPDSDARFATRWLRWTQEKKQKHVWGEKRLRELQDLMRSLLVSNEWLWEHDEQWRWDLAAGMMLPSLPYATHRIGDKSDERYSVFLEFARFWMNHFKPSSNHPALQTHRCVRDFTGWGSFWPTVEVRSAPTHHERLEARLYLREWLQQKAPERMDLLPD